MCLSNNSRLKLFDPHLSQVNIWPSVISFLSVEKLKRLLLINTYCWIMKSRILKLGNSRPFSDFLQNSTFAAWTDLWLSRQLLFVVLWLHLSHAYFFSPWARLMCSIIGFFAKKNFGQWSHIIFSVLRWMLCKWFLRVCRVAKIFWQKQQEWGSREQSSSLPSKTSASTDFPWFTSEFVTSSLALGFRSSNCSGYLK